MKLENRFTQCETVVLLLARGACIETVMFRRWGAENSLLLARGACIETRKPSNPAFRSSCSSQEEHVLKHVRQMHLQLLLGCSSQEEHVLKPKYRNFEVQL